MTIVLLQVACSLCKLQSSIKLEIFSFFLNTLCGFRDQTHDSSEWHDGRISVSNKKRLWETAQHKPQLHSSYTFTHRTTDFKENSEPAEATGNQIRFTTVLKCGRSLVQCISELIYKRVGKKKVSSFFLFISAEMSLAYLRRKQRQNIWWETLHDKRKKLPSECVFL